MDSVNTYSHSLVLSPTTGIITYHPPVVEIAETVYSSSPCTSHFSLGDPISIKGRLLSLSPSPELPEFVPRAVSLELGDNTSRVLSKVGSVDFGANPSPEQVISGPSTGTVLGKRSASADFISDKVFKMSRKHY